MTPCSRCTTPQLPNTLYCDACGHGLYGAIHPALAVKEGPSLMVELVERRQVVPLPENPEILFGRHDTRTGARPDVDLDNLGGREGGVSRLHARLIRQGEYLFLEDMGSMNGTFINEKRLPAHQPTAFKIGDQIRLGLLRLIIRPKK